MPQFLVIFSDLAGGGLDHVRDLRCWGRREYAGVVKRRDGKARVVFFQDPAGDGFLIPRDPDPWVRNIKRVA